MKKPAFKITCRALESDSSKISIRLRITDQGKVMYFALGIICRADHFSASEQKFIIHNDTNFKLNAFLSQVLDRAFGLYMELERDGKWCLTEFTRLFRPHENEFNFCAWTFERLLKRKNSLKPGSYKGQLSSLNKLKRYCHGKIYKNELNYNFISRYEVFLLQSGINKNTVSRHLRVLRTYVNLAIKEGYLKEYCFESFVIKEHAGNRTYITMPELKALETVYYEKDTFKSRIGLGAFLFSCYTGLRYGEIKNLKWQHLEGTILRVYQEKTDKTISVPLSKKALDILPPKSGSFIFRISSNQVLNKYLKRCAVIAKIRPITFHSARHTFATISLNLGMPIEVVSSLLGHSDIKTTQIYAKIVNETKVKAMKLWDDI